MSRSHARSLTGVLSKLKEIAPMAISPAQRAADSPALDYADQIVNEVRTRIQAEDWVLNEARARRDAVLKAAQRFGGR